MNATNVALPNTYHQLILLGTGCSIMGSMLREKPVRLSIQPTTWRTTLIGCVSADRQRASEDLDHPAVHSDLVAGQPVWRRPSRHRAVSVIDSTVAGTQEDPRV